MSDFIRLSDRRKRNLYFVSFYKSLPALQVMMELVTPRSRHIEPNNFGKKVRGVKRADRTLLRDIPV